MKIAKEDMIMSNPERNKIEMNAGGMYREETFTDNAVGTLRRLTPVKVSGEPDSTRSVQYIGSTQVMTQAGPLPLSFEIEAKSLTEAISSFGESAKDAFEKTMEELREMQRQQASSIVVPGAGGGGGGGGNIRMR
jgi:hypothetical protein